MPYTALVLEAESHEVLLSWVRQNHEVPEHFLVKGHHCTVDLKPIAKSMGAEFNGQKHELRVIRFGRLDGIMAVEVETVVPSKNERKHITVCHAPEVKPRASNDIVEWTDIPPFVLHGVVKEVE